MIRSRAEICKYQAKREMVAREKTQNTSPTTKAKLALPVAGVSPAVGDEVILRDVWEKEASLLIAQVNIQLHGVFYNFFTDYGSSDHSCRASIR